jgi:hypothetical protein
MDDTRREDYTRKGESPKHKEEGYIRTREKKERNANQIEPNMTGMEGPGQEMEVYQIDLGEVVPQLEEIMKRWKVLNKEWKYV